MNILAELKEFAPLIQVGGLGLFAFVVYRQGEKWGERIERAVKSLSSQQADTHETVTRIDERQNAEERFARVFTPPHGVKLP